MQNLLDLDYPKLSLIFVDDHSTDKSTEVVGGFDDEKIILIRNKSKGKTEGQNSALTIIPRGAIVIFNDCNVFLADDSIKAIVQCFHKDVGAAVGNVTIWESKGGKKGVEGTHWEWEKNIKLIEMLLKKKLEV